MTWTRVRTWVGRHPVWAINLVTVGSLVVIITVSLLVIFGRDRSWSPGLLVPVSLGAIVFVGVWTGYVSYLLRRAARPLRCLSYTVPSTMSIFVGTGMCVVTVVLLFVGPPGNKAALPTAYLNAALSGLVGALPFIVAQYIGRGVAAAVARAKLRGDRRQTLVALGEAPPSPDGPPASWSVQRPAWAVFAVAACVLLVYGNVLTIAHVHRYSPVSPQSAILYGLGPVCLVMLVASFALTGRSRRRSLPTRRVPWGAVGIVLMAPAISLSLALVWTILMRLESGRRGIPLDVASLTARSVLVGAVAAAATLVGWLLALWVSRRPAPDGSSAGAFHDVRMRPAVRHAQPRPAVPHSGEDGTE